MTEHERAMAILREAPQGLGDERYLLARIAVALERLADAEETGVEAELAEITEGDGRIDAASFREMREAARRVCTLPPLGWHCTRERGHEGPCAAVLVTEPLT